MRLRSFTGGLIGRPALRVLAGLPALLLLLPLPAMALTFTGNWAATYSQSGGPTPPKPTFSDVTNNAEQVDDLSVNMGNYQGSSAPATSTINLTRGISITAPGQDVDFAHLLVAGFQNAGTDITVSVKNSTGQTVVRPVQLNLNNTSKNLEYFLAFQNDVARLNKGNYTLNVQVQYFTNNKVGGWKSISAFHQFVFEGLCQ